MRREIISTIMCQFEFNYTDIANKYGLKFEDYFHLEINELKELETIGLVNLIDQGFQVTNKGRFLIRNIAKVFDKYLRLGTSDKRYSKVI